MKEREQDPVDEIMEKAEKWDALVWLIGQDLRWFVWLPPEEGKPVQCSVCKDNSTEHSVHNIDAVLDVFRKAQEKP
jgi:hypothetical protein